MSTAASDRVENKAHGKILGRQFLDQTAQLVESQIGAINEMPPVIRCHAYAEAIEGYRVAQSSLARARADAAVELIREPGATVPSVADQLGTSVASVAKMLNSKAPEGAGPGWWKKAAV